TNRMSLRNLPGNGSVGEKGELKGASDGSRSAKGKRSVAANRFGSRRRGRRRQTGALGALDLSHPSFVYDDLYDAETHGLDLATHQLQPFGRAGFRQRCRESGHDDKGSE